MKKILKGSVIITEEGTHYWVISHFKGFIKAVNESGKEQFIGEAMVSTAQILDGKDAMDIIRKYFY